MLNAILLSALLIVSAPAGKIAFIAGTEQEDYCVCVLELATRTVTRVGCARRDGAPAWSPDGKYIAFDTLPQQGGGLEIHVVHPDGTGNRTLPLHAHWNRGPVWAPDGKRLAYVAAEDAAIDAELEKRGLTSLPPVARQAIRIYNFDTQTEETWGGRTGLVNPVWLGKSVLIAALQTQFSKMAPEEAKVWSKLSPDPENTLLAIGFTHTRNGLSTEPFVVTREHALPLPRMVMPSQQGNYVEWNLRIHPNGKEIAFESNDGGDREIFLITRKRTYDVSNHRAADWNPVWSPRGKWIAFESFRNGGYCGIYRVQPDTARVFPVALEDGADCWAPSWSPDGKWIAYVDNASGKPVLMAVNVAKGQKMVLYETGENCLAPAWCPVSGEEEP